ncbi:hypothetical protein [Qipengyuania sp. MTN3-11]|uniref:hypothetical protein n=1 Tax=Qipengyuania sp. MTN3-11 TaxID=3056557 RepID=UPI0036F277AB
MFEGQIKGIDYPETGDSPVLRQLRWTDLMARLAATRDLREEAGLGAGERVASFAGFRRETGEEGKGSFNQDVLSRGKFARLDVANADDDAADGDRENI